MKIGSHIPFTVDIGEEEPLRLAVKRLSLEEGAQFRAKYDEAVNAKPEEKDALWGELLPDAFKRFVRIDCELLIECADGDIPVKRGDELLDIFGGEPHIINQILIAIVGQSRLTALQKKASSSRSGSGPSSGEQDRDRAGQKPETTAESAASAGSVGNGDATSDGSDPSGSTEPEKTGSPPSSPTSARSVH